MNLHILFDSCRRSIETPQEYQGFSENIFDATQKSVYVALASRVHPHLYKPDPQSSRKKPAFIHPFEIITIGSDDVLLLDHFLKCLTSYSALAFERFGVKVLNPLVHQRYFSSVGF
jgi:CRISPR-associated protein Cmr2